MTSYGNDLDHIASAVLAGQSRRAHWLMLRNSYFHDGTPDEAYARIQAHFAASGIGTSIAEEFDESGKLTQWVYFHRL